MLARGHFRLADVTQAALAVGTVFGQHLHETLELSLSSLVLFHISERSSIGKDRVGEIGDRRQSLGEFVVGAREEFVFASGHALVDENRSQLEVRERHIFVALGFGDDLGGSRFGGLPVLHLESIFDNFSLAVLAVATVLLVGLLESIDGPVDPALMQEVKSFLVGLLRLFVGGTCGALLGMQGGQGAG